MRSSRRRRDVVPGRRGGGRDVVGTRPREGHATRGRAPGGGSGQAAATAARRWSRRGDVSGSRRRRRDGATTSAVGRRDDDVRIAPGGASDGGQGPGGGSGGAWGWGWGARSRAFWVGESGGWHGGLALANVIVLGLSRVPTPFTQDWSGTLPTFSHSLQFTSPIDHIRGNLRLPLPFLWTRFSTNCQLSKQP